MTSVYYNTSWRDLFLHRFIKLDFIKLINVQLFVRNKKKRKSFFFRIPACLKSLKIVNNLILISIITRINITKV